MPEALYACYEVGSPQVPELLSKLYSKEEFLGTDIAKLVVTNFISDDEMVERFHEASLPSYVDEYFAVGIIKSLKNGGAYISFYEDEDQGKHQFFDDTRDLFFGFDPRLAGLNRINIIKIPEKDVVFTENSRPEWARSGTKTHYSEPEKEVVAGLVNALGNRVFPLLASVLNRTEGGLYDLAKRMSRKKKSIKSSSDVETEPSPIMKIERGKLKSDLRGINGYSDSVSNGKSRKHEVKSVRENKTHEKSKGNSLKNGILADDERNAKRPKIYKILTCREDNSKGAHDFRPWGPYLFCSYCGEIKDFTVL